MLRKLRVWGRLPLCLFLLPLALVFGLPGAASAATQSELLDVPMEGMQGIPHSGGNCRIPMAINTVTGGSQIVIGSGGWCAGPVDISPGYCGLYEVPCTKVEVEVFDQVGSCGTLDWETISSSGTFTTTMVMGSGTIGISSSCDPAEVCVTLQQDHWMPGFEDVTVEGCSLTELDQPADEEPMEGCLDGSRVSVPREGPVIYTDYTPDGQKILTREFWGGGINGEESTKDYIYFYQVWTDNMPMTWKSPAYNYPNVGVSFHRSEVVSPGGSWNWHKLVDIYGPWYLPSDWTDDRRSILGMGYFFSDSPNAHESDPNVRIPRGSTTPYGVIGISDDSRCLWYYGTRIADVVGETDIPIGPVEDEDGPDVPVVDPPPVPTPEAEEEETGWGWLLGILREIVSAIKSLGSAIAGIAQAILDGLTGLFSGLFVPDDGYLESRYTSIENKWADTSPAKYADAVSDFTVGSASGCGGLPLSLTLPGDVQVDQHIGAACSGTMASTAGVVRGVLTAVFVIGGLFACIRAVGSGLGWDPGVGRGAGA